MMDEGEDFEYEDDDDDDDDDQDDGRDASLENKYYTAKSIKQDNPAEAMRDLQAIVDAETMEKSEWGFKALKQLRKLSFGMQDYEQALSYYKQLLPYTKSTVTRNYAEKSINSILDDVSSSSNIDTQLMQKFYDETNKSLAEAKNDRLSTKTNLKLAKLWLDRKEYPLLTKIIRELHASLKPEDPNADVVDNSRGTTLLEILALEIQMYTEQRNNVRLRQIYDQTLHVKSAIPHPRIMGVIRECGGKMHMSEREWSKAQIDFFEAFRNYDEAGSPQRIQVLKYLVLAHMLMGSDIDPFDSQETKPYKNDRQIQAMTNLVSAYQRREVHEAEKLIRENRSTIMDDPFIREHIDEVLRSLRTQWIIDIIKPYTRIQMEYLARQLNVSTDDVEDILVALILDGKVKGCIDQVTGTLELESQNQLDKKRYASLTKWTDLVKSMQDTVASKSAQMGPSIAGGSSATGGMFSMFDSSVRVGGGF